MGIWFNRHVTSQCARSLIAVCSELHFGARSFCKKLNDGIAPKDKRLVRFDRKLIDIFALHALLQQCAMRRCLLIGKGCHGLAIHLGLASDTITCNILINLYTKCGMNDCARHVFDAMPFRSVVSWNTMIAGYTCNGDDLQALKIFSKMHQEGTHMRLVQNGLHEDALRLFRSSQREGMQLTEFTLSAILSTCASLALMIEGIQLHAVIFKYGFHSNFFVASSLVDVYASCGQIEEAYLIFADMKHKNVVLWNAMITSFTRHGSFWEAMILFEKMQQAGISPNEVTYLSMLSVCGHAGLVEEARCYFSLLISDQSVEPNVLHYSCMVDVLGRSGKTDEAWELIQQMPFEPTTSMWGSLLGSCRKYRNTRLARIAAAQLFKLKPENGGNHALLSDVYAAGGSWENAVLARKHLNDRGAKKDVGSSWIYTKGKAHIFGCEQKEEFFV